MNHNDYDELPSPDQIAFEAEEMNRKVPLRSYSRALHVMRQKGYSYAEIADWISKKLGVEVTRSQVSYVVNTPEEIQNEIEEAEEMADAAEEERGL